MNPTEAEQALLGALINGYDSEDLSITGADFYDMNHQKVFDAVARVRKQGERPDLVKVRVKLVKDRFPTDVGVYLHDLVLSCPSTASAPYYAKVVADAADRRGLEAMSDKIRQLADTDREPSELIEDARALLDQAPRRERSLSKSWSQIAPKVIDRIEKGVTNGLPTPWPDLNEVLHGLVGGRLYIVAARPGGGKSVMGQNIATYIAGKTGKTAYIASMEMSEEDYGIRIVADKASVSLDALLSGRLDDLAWQKVARAQSELEQMPLHINDAFTQSISDIRSGARDVARKQELGVVIVDYLQQIKARDPKVPRHEQVAEISRALKSLARELNVPVIAMSQLNRASEGRADKVPTMADLRESGAQEADADVVLLLHREDKDSGEVKVIPDKNRWGTQRAITLQFWGHYARLASAARIPQAITPGPGRWEKAS